MLSPSPHPVVLVCAPVPSSEAAPQVLGVDSKYDGPQVSLTEAQFRWEMNGMSKGLCVCATLLTFLVWFPQRMPWPQRSLLKASATLLLVRCMIIHIAKVHSSLFNVPPHPCTHTHTHTTHTMHRLAQAGGCDQGHDVMCPNEPTRVIQNIYNFGNEKLVNFQSLTNANIAPNFSGLKTLANRTPLCLLCCVCVACPLLSLALSCSLVNSKARAAHPQLLHTSSYSHHGQVVSNHTCTHMRVRGGDTEHEAPFVTKSRAGFTHTCTHAHARSSLLLLPA